MIKRFGFVILLFYLAVGFWLWPEIGVAALICMLAPVLVAFKSGRSWCGNYCPRGSLWDNVFAKINKNRQVPSWAKAGWFRKMMLILIFVVFGIQMYQAWPDLGMIGLVFLRIIFVTTIVGAILALIYSPRTWCNFCPMGTMAAWFSAGKKPLVVESSCVNCKRCARVCPMGLDPGAKKGLQFSDADCIKCGICETACPVNAISLSAETTVKKAVCVND